MFTGKNVLVGQSGGPTAVINASLAGVIQRAKLSQRVRLTLVRLRRPVISGPGSRRARTASRPAESVPMASFPSMRCRALSFPG